MTDSPYKTLDSEGGHLLLCKPSKAAVARRWQSKRADLDNVQGHADTGGLVGLIPRSLGLVVVDCDEEGAAEAAAEALGPPLATVGTPSGGCHLYYPHPSREVGNAKWAGGDIRGGKGYVIMWDAELVAGLLVRRAAWPAAPDLDALKNGAAKNSGATRATRIRNASEGERNDTLNREVYGWATNGGESVTELEVFRRAALDSGLEADEVSTTIESAQTAGRLKYTEQLPAAEGGDAMEGTLAVALGEYDVLLAPAAYGLGGRGPTADAIRLLAHAPERLLLVRHGDGERAELLVAAEGGRWARDRDALAALLHEATAKWLGGLAEGFLSEKVSAKEAASCYSHAATARTMRGLDAAEEHAGVANLFMTKKGRVPAALTVCQAAQLDELSRYIGAANGVYGLVERRMLDEREARAQLVTRSVRDAIIPDAEHADVDFLFAHLPERERDFLLGSLGWALGGNPSRRLLLLVTPPGGGKTTLLNIVNSALGDARRDGYGLTIDADELMTRRWGPGGHQDGLYGGQWARLAATEEPRQYSGHARFNEALLKHHAGGGSVSYSAKGEKSRGGAPWRATHLIATNPSGLTTLALSDEALADRAKILRYQPIPEKQRNPGKADSMPADAAVRQAMLALLLRSYPDEPPADIPSVQTMRAERRHATIGDAGTWLVEHVELTDNSADFLFRVDALDAAAAACGGRNADGEIDGRSERELTAIMASHVAALPAATAKRCAARDGHKERGWRGARLKQPTAEKSLRFYFDDTCPRCAPEQLQLDGDAWQAAQLRQARVHEAYVKLREAGRDLDQLDGLEDADLELLREVARHKGHGPAPAETPFPPVDPETGNILNPMTGEVESEYQGATPWEERRAEYAGSEGGIAHK